jgi:hypothetical protein
VTVWVTAVFTASLLKLKLDVLRLSVEAYAPSDNASVLELLEVDAVRVAVCAVLTAVAVAVKLAVVAPLAIWTDGGTVTAALLLARFTLMPPVGAPLATVTVQASVAAPVSEFVVQVSDDTAGRIAIVPVPLSPTVSGLPLVALLKMVRVPDSDAFVVGRNCTANTAV